MLPNYFNDATQLDLCKTVWFFRINKWITVFVLRIAIGNALSLVSRMTRRHLHTINKDFSAKGIRGITGIIFPNR